MLGGSGKGSVPLPCPSDASSSASPRATLRASRTEEGEGEAWVEPLAGENGGAVVLNGSPLNTARRLYDGDVLTVGEYRLRYENLGQASAHRARHRPFGQGRPRTASLLRVGDE